MILSKYRISDFWEFEKQRQILTKAFLGQSCLATFTTKMTEKLYTKNSVF